jgi:hypothetical protein
MSAPLSPTLMKSLRSLGVPVGPALQDGGPGSGDRRWLLTLRDGEWAHRVLLGGPPTLLGTSDACDILVEDPRVEPIHLQIVPHDDGAVFRAGGGHGFDCHGTHQAGEADVGFGTPVFIDDVLMLTIDPWVDED